MNVSYYYFSQAVLRDRGFALPLRLSTTGKITTEIKWWGLGHLSSDISVSSSGEWETPPTPQGCCEVSWHMCKNACTHRIGS